MAIKLDAEFKELNIYLANNKKEIAQAAIKGICIEILVKNAYTQITASLEDILIYDSVHQRKVCKLFYLVIILRIIKLKSTYHYIN